jgi:hypothetical protein
MGIKDWFGGDKKKAEYRDKVKEAVSDGKLSQTDIQELAKLREQLDVTDAAEDKTSLRREIFSEAFDAKKAKGELTQTGILDMAKIQKFLALRDDQISEKKVEMNRLRMLTEIRKGNIPVVPPTHAALRGVKLEPEEVAHYTVQVQMSSSSRTGDDGMPVDVNFKYSEGASRSHFLPEEGAKPVGDGLVIITNQRLIIKTESGKQASVKFGGEGQAFLYNEGLRVKGTMNNTLLKFKSGADETAEIVGELLAILTAR